MLAPTIAGTHFKSNLEPIFQFDVKRQDVSPLQHGTTEDDVSNKLLDKTQDRQKKVWLPEHNLEDASPARSPTALCMLDCGICMVGACDMLCSTCGAS